MDTVRLCNSHEAHKNDVICQRYFVLIFIFKAIYVIGIPLTFDESMQRLFL